MLKLYEATLSSSAKTAIGRLEGFFTRQRQLLVAFSGGMDSTFLCLAASHYLNDSYRAILVNSPFMPAEEIKLARAIAQKYSLNYSELAIDQLDQTNVAENSMQRCYHCKKLIFQHLIAHRSDSEVICEGSVTDDEDDFRPGKAAIKELNIYSPLAECGFSKAIIREVLTAMQAHEIIRPGQSCLATRIASGCRITAEKLLQIDHGEDILRKAGIQYCRLRHHGDMARIEVNPVDRHRALDAAAMHEAELKKLGFKYVCIDVSGYRKGSMN